MGMLSTSESEDFAALFRTLSHRGPDAHHIKSEVSGRWRVQLGHHRLSIIDVEGGIQPMCSGTHSIVFNGEVYNFSRLKKLLPHTQWRTRSDTEVVLELVRERGTAALRELDGFFAFATFDHSRDELVLARDRWGIKPLYFAKLADGGLLFASELHPFLRAKQIRRQASLDSVLDYLFWDHVPYDRSMIEGVHKLEPGHYLHWQDGVIETGPYYDRSTLLSLPRHRTVPSRLWETISSSVSDALTADVPVGVLLSGGLDSSLIAVAAKGIKGEALPSFSIGFDEADFDESPYARQMAQFLGGEHFERRIGAADMLERWSEIIASLDEPLADPSLIPTRFLCELAREHVPVVLGGDGGDELFGGYPTYRAHRLRSFLHLVPEGVMAGLSSWTRDGLRMGDGYQPLAWKLKRLFGRYDREPLRGHFRWMSGTDLSELQRLAGSTRGPHIRQLPEMRIDDLQSYLYLDLCHYLPYTVLTKVDRASMAVGLECRPPLLSNACVEHAFSIPPEQKVSAWQTKMILREAAETHLPPSICDRSKRGFAIPLASWLKGPLAPTVEGMLKESPLWDGLEVSGARHLWESFRSGSGDHAKSFWALLVLHHWLSVHHIRVQR